MPPRAVLTTIVILGALLIVGAAVAARRGRLTGRTSKLVMVGVIAVAGIVVMLYPFLGFHDTVGD
jgi:uncharacterized membrane protein YhaH (DUF805 family)